MNLSPWQTNMKPGCQIWIYIFFLTCYFQDLQSNLHRFKCLVLKKVSRCRISIAFVTFDYYILNSFDLFSFTHFWYISFLDVLLRRYSIWKERGKKKEQKLFQFKGNVGKLNSPCFFFSMKTSVRILLC